MAAISRRRESADYTWPGYVDALTTLLMVLIFLLSIFSVAQFTLSTVLSSRETAIDTLNKQIGDLASQLSLEKRSAEDLQKDVARLTLLSRQLQAEREKLNADVTAQKRSADDLKAERDRLSAMLKDATREVETKAATAGDMQKEIERQKLELTRLAAALAAANNEKGKLFSDLTEEQKQTAEQKANTVRLAAEMNALRQELTRLNAALEAADAKAKEQNAQIIDLGQKLNRALASKVEELARYRSEFFGKLREALAGQRDVQIVGDRFVFQSEVLFPSGSAQLQQSGEKQLASVAQRLVDISSKIPKEINWVLQVDGHTDNKPINTREFPSNWELSAARAIAVVKFLNAQGIPNERLAAAGYGEYQPLSMMDTARNRRIELKLTNR
ncbi:MAG: peptidoglycan -binding protein [Reyranella sp.]|uniref:peptidoglycan -binding protein n=1 Tax=Reyranella sp. TaxID=1929291 RepID=UPI001AD18C39|nr:peptidoglycan -binding protein [Reyranella sp.]MBN9085280.1 peptidoglycan -binding protein [Reyranella sp.]